MMFADSPRFKNNNLSSLGQDCEIMGVASPSSSSPNVGPGAYYSSKLANQRNGWTKKSYSNREPMSPRNDKVRKAESYVNGTIHKGEYMAGAISHVYFIFCFFHQ